jgi:hypothetical protein
MNTLNGSNFSEPITPEEHKYMCSFVEGEILALFASYRARGLHPADLACVSAQVLLNLVTPTGGIHSLMEEICRLLTGEAILQRRKKNSVVIN